jgi:hypothetical protein
MPHGTPDYGVTGGASTVYQVKDLGELAARLGSPITYDRRGDVIWWDDFECGLAKWGIALSGLGAAGAMSTTRARNGRSSLLLTGGSTANRTAIAIHDGPYARLSRFGFEWSFNFPVAFDYVQGTLELYDGVNHTLWHWLWSDTLNAVQYLDGATALDVTAASVNLTAGLQGFQTMKLVVDPATGRYVRGLFNDREIELDGVSGLVLPDATPARVQLAIEVHSRAGNNDQVYIDDVIITQNEPANG